MVIFETLSMELERWIHGVEYLLFLQRTWFDSQPPCGSSQLSATPVPGDLMFCFDVHRHRLCVWCINTHANKTHTHAHLPPFPPEDFKAWLSKIFGKIETINKYLGLNCLQDFQNKKQIFNCPPHFRIRKP